MMAEYLYVISDLDIENKLYELVHILVNKCENERADI